jgi:hypothetical protein
LPQVGLEVALFFDPLEVPDDLLMAQEQCRLVIFAGAGTAMGEPSNLPSFKELAKRIAHGTPLANEIDEYDDKLDRFLGDLARNGVDVQRLCREIIGNPSSKPNELHRSLIDLFIDPAHLRIVTTNFDPHFSTILTEKLIAADRFCAPALPLGDNFKGLVYLHGSLLRPEPLVLADEDFGRAYLSEGWAREFLHRLFAEFTILFVGYSHTDAPVQYLARGMSARPMAKRYALAAPGDSNLWMTLGVKVISFEKTSGENPYENLYKGITKWAQFTRQQPTDIAARVREIVCAPEQIKPDKAESGLLRRCLERKDSCHFFTQHAKGWRWIEWMDEQGLLKPLFDPNNRMLTVPQIELAFWLGPALLSESSAKALLLVDKHDGVLGERLWSAVCRSLWRDDKLDWNAPLTQKWLLLLISASPATSSSELSAIFPMVAQKSLRTLGLTMLRHLLAIRPVLKRAMDFSSLLGSGDTFEVGDKIEFEIESAGEPHSVETTWHENFKPHVAELEEPLLTLFEDKLRQVHEILQADGRADPTYDPYTYRGRIYDRDRYRARHGGGLVVDFVLDVMEGLSAQGLDVAGDRLRAWILSRIPTLVRLGLYGLYLAKATNPADKVNFLRNHGLIFPTVYGAMHESYIILTECYPELTEPERKAFWELINSGPSAILREGETPEQQAETRQNQIDKLTWGLGTKNPTCPLAAEALKQLKARAPDFVGHEGMDQVMFGGGITEGTEGARSPKTAADLIAEPAASQVDFLLTYTGGTAPFQESRDGLLVAIRTAAAQNQGWAADLLRELDKRQRWTSDLWDAAFWGMKLPSLAQEELNWLLQVLNAHFAHSTSLQGLSQFLFIQVDLSEGKEPSEENLELMIQLSLHIWKQVIASEPAKTEKFEETEWLDAAINQTAGHIVDFWMKLCGRIVRKAGGQSTGFPEWLKQPLTEMIAGKSLAAQLGMAMLGERLAFVQFLNPGWVRTELFPRLRFTETGEAAFLLWEPHVCHGKLSRDLILEMPPIYRQAFGRFQTVRHKLLIGFLRHIGVIVYSGLFDVTTDGWFAEFLLGLNDVHRAEWANQMGFMLEGAPPDRKAQIWQRWMKSYWQERLRGRPCSLSGKEVEEMVDWTVAMSPVFNEAVEMLIQSPSINGGRKLGTAIHLLEQNDTPVAHPEAFLKLMKWLLEQGDEQWMVSNDIEKVIFRLPKKKSLLGLLNAVCQKLASLGYRGAESLKQRVEREFIEE